MFALGPPDSCTFFLRGSKKENMPRRSKGRRHSRLSPSASSRPRRSRRTASRPTRRATSTSRRTNRRRPQQVAYVVPRHHVTYVAPRYVTTTMPAPPPQVERHFYHTSPSSPPPKPESDVPMGIPVVATAARYSDCNAARPCAPGLTCSASGICIDPAEDG